MDYYSREKEKRPVTMMVGVLKVVGFSFPQESMRLNIPEHVSYSNPERRNLIGGCTLAGRRFMRLNMLEQVGYANPGRRNIIGSFPAAERRVMAHY